MKSIITTSILIALAAICNACMDAIDHHGVFASWGAWWASTVSYSSTGWYLLKPLIYDAWHCFKQIMIACFLIATLKYTANLGWLITTYYKPKWNKTKTKAMLFNLIQLLFYFGIWSGVHKLFYQVILN